MWIYDPQADEIVPLDNKKYIARAFLINNSTETLICTDGKGLKCFNNETRAKYTSLAVAALTATLLASTNNSKVQAATVDKNNTVTVAKSDKEKLRRNLLC